MKRILNVLKTLLYGIMPAVSGGLILMDVLYVIKNIQLITTTSGWNVVLYFILGSIEAILAVMLLYELGKLRYNAKKWTTYNETEATNNIDGGSDENETFNEAADI